MSLGGTLSLEVTEVSVEQGDDIEEMEQGGLQVLWGASVRPWGSGKRGCGRWAEGVLKAEPQASCPGCPVNPVWMSL